MNRGARGVDHRWGSSPRRLSVKRKSRRAFGVCESRKKTRLDWQHRTWAFFPAFSPRFFLLSRKEKVAREVETRVKMVSRYKGMQEEQGTREERRIGGRWDKRRERRRLVRARDGQNKRRDVEGGVGGSGNGSWTKSRPGSFARGKIFNPFARWPPSLDDQRVAKIGVAFYISKRNIHLE